MTRHFIKKEANLIPIYIFLENSVEPLPIANLRDHRGLLALFSSPPELFAIVPELCDTKSTVRL